MTMGTSVCIAVKSNFVPALEQMATTGAHTPVEHGKGKSAASHTSVTHVGSEG